MLLTLRNIWLSHGLENNKTATIFIPGDVTTWKYFNEIAFVTKNKLKIIRMSSSLLTGPINLRQPRSKGEIIDNEYNRHPKPSSLSSDQLQFCIQMHFVQIEFRSRFFLLLHILLALAHGTLLRPRQTNSPEGANWRATQSIN